MRHVRGLRARDSTSRRGKPSNRAIDSSREMIRRSTRGFGSRAVAACIARYFNRACAVINNRTIETMFFIGSRRTKSALAYLDWGGGIDGTGIESERARAHVESIVDGRRIAPPFVIKKRFKC